MKSRNLDLLTLLISLFILSSCNSPMGIGLDVDPNVILNSSIHETDVITKLVKDDSIATNYTERSVLSYMKDAEFGKTTTNIALAVTLPSSNVSFGKDPILDSAVLVLKYAASAPIYGDSASYKVLVNQLSEKLYDGTTNKVYYSNKEWTTESTVVGSKTFFPAYNDSLSIKLYGYQDSTVKIPAQLRIPLDNQFIINKIVSLDSATLSTSQKFADSFKGLKLSFDKNSVAGKGGAISFDTYSENAASLVLYYRYTNSEDKADTTSKTFPINGSLGAAVTEVLWDATGSNAAAALSNTTNNNEKLYLKGFSGTKIKAEFPNLQDLSTLGKNIAINRAELIFTIEEETPASFDSLSVLRIYKLDPALLPKYIPEENTSDPRYVGAGLVGGYYNKSKKTYILNVTGYIQDLFKKKYANEGTFITTYDFVGKTGRLNSPGRSILIGGGNNSANKPKLKIYYSDLK